MSDSMLEWKRKRNEMHYIINIESSKQRAKTMHDKTNIYDRVQNAPIEFHAFSNHSFVGFVKTTTTK